MRHKPHLVASISGHGFGHVAQIASILNRLPQRMPPFRIKALSAVPFGLHSHCATHQRTISSAIGAGVAISSYKARLLG